MLHKLFNSVNKKNNVVSDHRDILIVNWPHFMKSSNEKLVDIVANTECEPFSPMDVGMFKSWKLLN